MHSSVYDFAAPQSSQQRVFSRRRTTDNLKNQNFKNEFGKIEQSEETTSSQKLEPFNKPDISEKYKIEKNHLDQTIDLIAKGPTKSYNTISRLAGRKQATQKKCEYCGKELKYPSKIEV